MNKLTNVEWNVDQIFQGFRVATMADPGTQFPSPESSLSPAFGDAITVPDSGYGALEDVAIGVTGGVIEWIVRSSELPEASPETQFIQGHNRWLTPGLIDCHTHLVHGGNRADEWEARLSGVSYEDIARRGGGILSSVRATREATLESLLASAARRLVHLRREGVTTVEIKSGYGLDVETELKMLDAASQLADQTGIDVQATLLGAHAVPPEFKGRADAYVDLVCEEMIPAAQGRCQAVDAFCESIAFSVSQTKRVLQAGLDAGLGIKVHAEQLSHLGMAAEAARMGAMSVDHLEYLTDDDCVTLARHGTVATLLPGAFYCLKEKQKPPVAALVANEVPIAIATDCNPGSSPVVSILMMGNMACNLFGLTPEQSLRGMTCHAAQALRLDDRGVIRPGAIADFAVWNVDSPGQIFYQIGGMPCVASFKRGVRQSRTSIDLDIEDLGQ